MKKLIRNAFSCMSVLLIAALSMNTISARTTAGKPLPADVMKIVKKSCMSCHADRGNMKARTALNFSKWDSYSEDKQAAKAKKMCGELTKDKMPPKKYREKHPEDVPTKAEVKTICDWSASLQPAQK